MRCKCCNVILTDEEATHKNAAGEYFDTCFSCLYGPFADDDNEFLEEWLNEQAWPDKY